MWVTEQRRKVEWAWCVRELLETYYPTAVKVRLVCDNGRFHHTKAVRAWLEAHRHRVEVYWLPPYCPSLNRIERLWGHLKRTVSANVLFTDLEDLVAAFRKGVGHINGHRQRMGFMFRHGGQVRQAA